RGIGFGDDFHSLDYQVWQPHFESLLLDTLAEDIFDHVGKLTSLADLARELAGSHHFQGPYAARAIALVLSGQAERAAEYVAELESEPATNPYCRNAVQELRRIVDRDITSVCADYHAREAEAAKALKVEDIWEPSPFPAELPEAERAAQWSEPTFVTTPWV